MGRHAPLLIAACVHLGLALWVFWGCLWGDRFPFGRDTVSHDILFFDFGWSAVRETGLIPLWNHHLFAGWPWVAAAGWTPWYPPHWVALALPAAFAFTVQYVFHHMWAGLGFTLWGMRLGFGLGPALLAGVLFQMSGHFTTLVHPGHLAKFEAIAWMPWVLAMAHPAFKRGSQRHAVLAALCLAMQILTQHAQIVYYTAAMLVAFALWRQARGLISDRSLFALRPLRLLVVIGALGAAVAAVQLLPATEMIRVSNRAEGVSWEEAIQTSYPPEELVELVWPGLFGSSVDGTYHGRWGERLVSDYLGLVVLVGMLLGIGRAVYRQMQSPGRPQRAWSLLALIALTLLLALGGHTPVYRVFCDWVPGWDRWRSPATIMCVTTFACCTLAGMGWTALLNRGHIRVRHLGTALVVLLILLAAADQRRVVREYVQVAGVRCTEMKGEIQRQFIPSPSGRQFIHTQEMSNAPMLAGARIITGYHPIVLNSYQRLFETLGYNNHLLHRLLDVSTWLTPEGMLLDSPFVLRPRRTLRWRIYGHPESGEGVWMPGTVESAPDQTAALEALRHAADSGDVFSTVAIVGIDPSETQSGGETVLASQCADLGPGLLNEFADAFVQLYLFPRAQRWVVISMPTAPGWRVRGISENEDESFVAHMVRRDRGQIPGHPLEIYPAWGVLWAVHLQGDEVFLFAEYRPATVRLGLFITLASLALALALLIRWRRIDQ